MKNTLRLLGVSLVAAPLFFSQAAMADGAGLYKSKGCAGCHGADAMGAVGPRLAGQQEKYLSEQFKLIRDGQRASGKAGMMAGAVKSVSDADADAIATYLAGLK